jgi:hypothetical protein
MVLLVGSCAQALTRISRPELLVKVYHFNVSTRLLC